jgi:Acetyltransferase (GNAT) domain
MRGWLEPAASNAGATLDYWVVQKGDEWVAALPVTWKRRFGRPFYAGLPLAAYSTILYRPTTGGHPASTTREHLEVTEALLTEVARRCSMTSLLLSPTIDDARPWIWSRWRTLPRYTYVIDLRSEMKLTDSVRRHVRKCEEGGFRISDEWDLPRFQSALNETKQRQGFDLAISPESLRVLAHSLREARLAWMRSALDPRGELAASQIVLSIPGTERACMWVAGASNQHLQSGASSWLMVKIAEAAKQRGHASYDLCGADIASVARFKAELGGRLVHYFQVDAPRNWMERRLRDAKDLTTMISRAR